MAIHPYLFVVFRNHDIFEDVCAFLALVHFLHFPDKLIILMQIYSDVFGLSIFNDRERVRYFVLILKLGFVQLVHHLGVELRPFNFVHIQRYYAFEQRLLPAHELFVQKVVVVRLFLVYFDDVLLQQLNVSLFYSGAKQLNYRHFFGKSDVRNLLPKFLDQVFNVGLPH